MMMKNVNTQTKARSESTEKQQSVGERNIAACRMSDHPMPMDNQTI
jgi:hypothetical protein